MGSGRLEALKNQSLYEVLNVAPEASIEQIKESYKEIARIYHPDSNFYSDIISVPLTAEEEEIFKFITSAYNTLVNPDKRAEYDKSIPKGLKGWDEEEAPVKPSYNKPQATETKPRDTKIVETSASTERPEDFISRMERLRTLQEESLRARAASNPPSPQARNSKTKSIRSKKTHTSPERPLALALIIGAGCGCCVGIALYLIL